MTIISRASSKSSEKKLKIAGVTNVVMPEKVGGAHMATLVTSPDVIEFLEHVSVRGDAPTNLVEITCSQLPKENLNKSIYEIGVRKKTGANIIGFKTPDGEYIINPTPNTKVIPNSKLFVLGTPEQITEMKEIFRAVTK
jgi:voltage-gated potassium channel